MRPGQTAPECASAHGQPRLRRGRFNEAGADCPGMLRRYGIATEELDMLQ